MEGASLFSILPRKRDRRLLRLLVAYQVMWDFLDSVSERGGFAGQANGRQLHCALVEALDPEAPISDYYRHHPWKADGGYLLALVETCRRRCDELPSYEKVRHLVLDGVRRCSIQSLNHEPEPRRRETALREWAASESTAEHDLDWFEWAAAAGAFMPHVLLALAADSSCEYHDLVAVQSTYFPWVALVISMLDSYVDRARDATSESHSYISHYPDDTLALERLTAVIRRVVTDASRLPNGRRHVVLTEGILAMYLSTPGVGGPRSRESTRALANAGGPLARPLLSVARFWRATRGRQSKVGRLAGALPPGLPLPRIVKTYLIWREPFVYMERCHARYGKRFTHAMANFPALVCLSDPAEIKAMLTAPVDTLHPGEGGAMIAQLVGETSFMLQDEDEHLHGRRAVTPALHKRVIEKEVGWVRDAVRHAIASWPRDVSVALHPRLRVLTLEVILRRSLVSREGVCKQSFPALRDRTLAMMAVTGSVVFPLPALRYGPGSVIWRRFLRQRSDVDELIYAVIRKRRQQEGSDHDDVLATLLGARNADGSKLSQRQLRDNVVTMFVAGHETTAAQLAWAFQLLAHNPRVQERLIDEIDQGGGDSYLTATIQEVLRHRPVFLFTVPRVVRRPIEIGGWSYEPPARLLACTYLLHHDPDIYPEPQEFRPERFLDGQPGPYTYLPWGMGRRRCPGSHLALLEMKTVLRSVLETMTVSPASRRMERPRWRSVIVTPRAGSRVVLHQRKSRYGPPRRPRRTTVRACPAPIRTADIA